MQAAQKHVCQRFLCLITASFWFVMDFVQNRKIVHGLKGTDGRFTELLSHHPHLFLSYLISFTGQLTSCWPYMAAVRGQSSGFTKYWWYCSVHLQTRWILQPSALTLHHLPLCLSVSLCLMMWADATPVWLTVICLLFTNVTFLHTKPHPGNTEWIKQT